MINENQKHELHFPSSYKNIPSLELSLLAFILIKLFEATF